MTVIAILMALCSPVYHALAAATRVSPSLEMNIIDIPHEPLPMFTHPWSPSELAGDPTYLGPAVRAPHPVTAPFLQKQNLAARAVESLPFLNQILDKT